MVNEEDKLKLITVSEAEKRLKKFMNEKVYPPAKAYKNRSEKKISNLTTGLMILTVGLFVLLLIALMTIPRKKKGGE